MNCMLYAFAFLPACIYICVCSALCMREHPSFIYRVCAFISSRGSPSIVKKKRKGEKRNQGYMWQSSSCHHAVTLLFYSCGWRNGGVESAPFLYFCVSIALVWACVGDEGGLEDGPDHYHYRPHHSNLSGMERVENGGGSPQSMSSWPSSPAPSPSLFTATPNGRRF